MSADFLQLSQPLRLLDCQFLRNAGFPKDFTLSNNSWDDLGENKEGGLGDHTSRWFSKGIPLLCRQSSVKYDTLPRQISCK